MAGRLRARPAGRVVWCGHHAARETTGVDGKHHVSETRPMWPASAALPADWPRLTGAWGRHGHDLTLKEGCRGPAGRSLCHPVDTGRALVARRRSVHACAHRCARRGRWLGRARPRATRVARREPSGQALLGRPDAPAVRRTICTALALAPATSRSRSHRRSRSPTSCRYAPHFSVLEEIDKPDGSKHFMKRCAHSNVVAPFHEVPSGLSISQLWAGRLSCGRAVRRPLGLTRLQPASQPASQAVVTVCSFT